MIKLSFVYNNYVPFKITGVPMTFLIYLVTTGSSRQGVGTVHESSNIAASLWVIDNMCTPRIGCLLSPSNSGTARVTGPGSDWNCRETSCACLDSSQHPASLFLKKSRHQYFPSLHRVTRGSHTLGTSMLCLWGCGSRGCISLVTINIKAADKGYPAVSSGVSFTLSRKVVEMSQMHSLIIQWQLGQFHHG